MIVQPEGKLHSMKYRFDDIELDCDLFQLTKEGEPAHVEPRVFSLLQFLLENNNTVVSHDALITAVWDGRVVSDAAVATAIASARKALGDSGKQQRYIKTVRGRGIRFVAQLHAESEPDTELTTAWPANDAASAVETQTPAIENTGQTTGPKAASITMHPAGDPSLMVLPFRVNSKHPSAVECCQTLHNSLEIVLMRISLLQIKSFSLRRDSWNAASDMTTWFRDNDIDYVVEGSIQALTDSLVIQLQFSDCRTGLQLWAERFSIPGDYVTALEPGLVQLVKKLEPRIHRELYKKAQHNTADNKARLLYLQANSLFTLEGWHHDMFKALPPLLRSSRQADSQFSLSAAALSVILSLGRRLALLDDSQASVEEVIDAAEAALALDGMDSRIVGLAGIAYSDLGQLERAKSLLQYALELNPRNAEAMAALGSVYLSNQQPDRAVKYLTQGMNLSALDSRMCVWGSLLSSAYRYCGQLPQALREAELACQRGPRAYIARVVLAGACYEDGNQPAAVRALADATQLKPDLTAEQICRLLGRGLGASLHKLSAE